MPCLCCGSTDLPPMTLNCKTCIKHGLLPGAKADLEAGTGLVAA